MKIAAASTLLSLTVIAAGLLTSSAWAAPFDTEIVLTASDAAADDRLGQAVAIEGNIAVVGANRNDDAGTNSGSAYLFDTTTGNELFKLTASDAEAKAIFGHSVAIDGTTAIVSAYGDNHAGTNSGSVYLFDVITGNELLKLTASDAAEGDQFGHGLDISGDRVIAGSYRNDDAGRDSGSAYLFDATTGEELFKLTASDAAAGDWFGYWTAISGNIAVVGSRRADGVGTNSGAVYLFDVTTGNELMKLTASDAKEGDEFGYAVDIEGNKLIVGTWGYNYTGGGPGSAYVFNVSTGNELFKLTPSDHGLGDEYGYAVGISGNTAIVGSFGDNADSGSNSGSAYLFDLTFGDELLKFSASDPAGYDEFGTAVGISGNKGLAGAWRTNSSTVGPDVGQAYLFDFSTVIPPGADFNNDSNIDNEDLELWESSLPIPRLDVNRDKQVDGADFLLWQRSVQVEILLDESPANLDQQGAVDSDDMSILEQSFGIDGLGDLDNDGDTDGADFLVMQRETTGYVAADKNLDQLVDGQDLLFWDISFGWDADIDEDGNFDGDANGDGVVDVIDFQWWQQQSANATAIATTTTNLMQVPEPASWLLFTGLLLNCLTGYRYRQSK
ncbi:MAG: PQQ-binding-like beta-propeller repeat protein [Pirellulales bacterium]